MRRQGVRQSTSVGDALLLLTTKASGTKKNSVETLASTEQVVSCVRVFIVACAGLFLPATEFSFILFTRLFFSLVCLSDALRLNLRTEKQFVDASREKVAKIFPTFVDSIYFSTVFHVGEEIGEFVSVVDCRETFLWRTIADEERKDRLSFVLLIRRKEENKNTKESGEEDGRVLYV
jgi:hypothetical protein